MKSRKWDGHESDDIDMHSITYEDHFAGEDMFTGVQQVVTVERSRLLCHESSIRGADSLSYRVDSQ